MKKLAIPVALLAMLLLLASAFWWDCVRYASAARARVFIADDEVRKQEARLVKILSDSGKSTDEANAAVAAYQSAPNPQARQERFELIFSAFQKSMSGSLDVTSPLDRKLSDEVIGAMNRRRVAMKAYDEEAKSYQDFLGSFRGRVASLFSSQHATLSAESG
jgi:hypothetical protein